MFKNVKKGDRVWDFVYGWGNIINVRKDYPLPIVVDFGNGKITSYKLNGKYNDTDFNPRLFWNEIKYEIPENPFNLEDELKKLEVVKFSGGNSNYFLIWNNEYKRIGYDYYEYTEYPLVKYFSKESIEEFIKNIKGKNIKKEQFFDAYNKVFGGI